MNLEVAGLLTLHRRDFPGLVEIDNLGEPAKRRTGVSEDVKSAEKVGSAPRSTDLVGGDADPIARAVGRVSIRFKIEGKKRRRRISTNRKVTSPMLASLYVSTFCFVTFVLAFPVFLRRLYSPSPSPSASHFAAFAFAHRRSCF